MRLIVSLFHILLIILLINSSVRVILVHARHNSCPHKVGLDVEGRVPSFNIPVSIYPKDVFEMVGDRNAASSFAQSSQRRLVVIETEPRYNTLYQPLVKDLVMDRHSSGFHGS